MNELMRGDPRLVSAQLLTARQVADLLQIHARSVWRLVATGQLKAVRLGSKMVRFRLTDIEEFIAKAESCR